MSTALRPTRRARLTHLLELSWAHGGFGRTLVVTSDARLVRELRSRAFLAEHAEWEDAVTRAERGQDRFDAVVVIAPADTIDAALRQLAPLAERWLVVAAETGAPGARALTRQALSEICADTGWSEYPFGPVASLQEGDVVMLLSEPKRTTSEDWAACSTEFCQWVASSVRPNDQVACLGALGDAAVGFLWMQTEASRIGVLEPPDMFRPVTWLRTRSDQPTARTMHDVILVAHGAAELVDRVLLDRLIPGGRLLLEADSQLVKRLSQRLEGFGFREAEAPFATPGASCFVSFMKTPIGGETVPYRETVFPVTGVTTPAIVDFARHYDNPWLVHSLIIGRFRVRDGSMLQTLAERALAGARPASADQGGALCVLAYQALAGQLTFGNRLRGAIWQYLKHEPSNPHVWRWQISLRFAIAKLDLVEGTFARAERGFAECARMDFMDFAPHLGTKCAEAAFLAGWLAWQRHDVDAAEQAWQAGLDVHARASRASMGDILIDPGCPSSFEAGDGLREMTIIADHAFRCANGVRAAAHMRTRGSARPGAIDRNFQNNFRDIEGFLARSNSFAAECVQCAVDQRRDHATQTLQRERTRTAEWLAHDRMRSEQMLERERVHAQESLERDAAFEAQMAARDRTHAAHTAERARAHAEQMLERDREYEAWSAERDRVLAAQIRTREADIAGRDRITAGYALLTLALHERIAGLEREVHQARIDTQLNARRHLRTIPLSRMKRLVIFGTGRAGQFAAEMLGRHHHVVGFLDNNPQRQGGVLRRRPIYAPATIREIEYDGVLVATVHVGEILRQLNALQVPQERVVLMHEVLDRLVVFGAGAGGAQVLASVPNSAMITHFVDNAVEKQGTKVSGIPVIGPADLRDVDYRYIVIASLHREAIERQLRKLGVPRSKMVAVEPFQPISFVGARVDRSVPAETRSFHAELEAEELGKVVSFGRHAGTAALLDFEPATLAIGVALASGGCQVKAFGAPAFVHQCGAKGILAEAAPFSEADTTNYNVLVAGNGGLPSYLEGRLKPEHRLISMRRENVSAHLDTPHLSFWYAPPRAWLAGDASTERRAC